jgi:hypothetical protein
MHGSTIFALASLCGTCEKYLLILKFWPYNCRGTFFAFLSNGLKVSVRRSSFLGKNMLCSFEMTLKLHAPSGTNMSKIDALDLMIQLS